MNNNFKKLYNLLLSCNPEKSDAAIWLQGDRFDRGEKVLELYKSKLAKMIIISGNDVLIGFCIRPGENNISLSDMKSYLIKNGVSGKNIIIDNKSLNTIEQAINTIKLAKQRNWEKLILVSSAYNQPRAFLTFVAAAQTISYEGKINNQCVDRGEGEIASGRIKTNRELMKDEKVKIDKYQLEGDVASYADGFDYLKKKTYESH